MESLTNEQMVELVTTLLPRVKSTITEGITFCQISYDKTFYWFYLGMHNKWVATKQERIDISKHCYTQEYKYCYDASNHQCCKEW